MKETIAWVVSKNEKEKDTFMIDVGYPDTIRNIIDELHEIENQANSDLNINIGNWFSNGENFINEEQLAFLKRNHIKFDEKSVIDGKLYFFKPEEFLDVWIRVMKAVRPNILINKFEHKTFEHKNASGLF